jgi:hypothetical protein
VTDYGRKSLSCNDSTASYLALKTLPAGRDVFAGEHPIVPADPRVLRVAKRLAYLSTESSRFTGCVASLGRLWGPIATPSGPRGRLPVAPRGITCTEPRSIQRRHSPPERLHVLPDLRPLVALVLVQMGLRGQLQIFLQVAQRRGQVVQLVGEQSAIAQLVRR